MLFLGCSLQVFVLPATTKHAPLACLMPLVRHCTVSLLQLLDAAAKVLVNVSKGVDVTPDKVAKRYTEVGAAFWDEVPAMQWHAADPKSP